MNVTSSFPYIYEEQSLVMEDDNGRRNTRRAKRYTRVETGWHSKIPVVV